MDRKPVGGTKMDKDILARRLEQLRSRVVHKQVASGREFKGRPFNSKPECVHFKVGLGPPHCALHSDGGMAVPQAWLTGPPQWLSRSPGRLGKEAAIFASREVAKSPQG